MAAFGAWGLQRAALPLENTMHPPASQTDHVQPEGVAPAEQQATPPAAEERGTEPATPLRLDMATLLRSLQRRWLLAGVLGAVAGVVAAAGAWNYVSPSKYSARALLHVAANPPQVVFPTGEPRSDFATYRQTQLALLKSRLVLATALRAPDVAALRSVQGKTDPLPWLENQVKVDYSGGPEILRIAMKGNEPEELTTLVNGLVTAYLVEIVNKEDEKRRVRLEQLQGLHKDYEGRLADKRQALTRLARTAGSNDARVLAVKQELALKRLHSAQQELIQRQSQGTRLEVELAALLAREQSAQPLDVTEQQVEAELNRDPVIGSRREEIRQLETILADIRRVAARGAADASHEQYARVLAKTREELRQRLEQQRTLAIDQLRARARTELRASIIRLQDQLAVQKSHQRVLITLVERLGQEPRALNESSLDLETLRTEIAEAEGFTKRISGEIEALKIEVHAPPRVTSLERAVVLPTQEEQRRLLLTLLGGLGAFSLGLLGVAWWDCRLGTLTAPADAVEGLRLRPLGTVPRLPPARRQELLALDAMQGSDQAVIFAEAIDATRTLLVHTLKRNGSRCVLVTSAIGGEGKTSLAIALAISLARAGYRTLLADGDLHRPALHGVFGLAATPGLCELLRGETSAAAVVQETALPGLTLLAAGTFDARAAQALTHEPARAAFAALSADYDYVIVDSSPVLPVASTLQLARCSDGVVFSVLRDVSRLPISRAACQRLSALGVPLFGVVVQGVRGEGYDRYYTYAAANVAK